MNEASTIILFIGLFFGVACIVVGVPIGIIKLLKRRK